MGISIQKRHGVNGVTDTDFGACRVLMLEPSVGTARLLGGMLLRDIQVGAVHRVVTLGEAVKALAGGEFNVLISDWSRQTDALKLVSALRSPKSVDRYFPAIVMTANRGQKNISALRDVGVDEVIYKPFTLRAVRSRLLAVSRSQRTFIVSDHYFGPDRRRYRTVIDGTQRRQHANLVNADRRKRVVRFTGTERRQGLPGYVPSDRRANNVRAKIAQLEQICQGLDVPSILALRRLTLSEPRFQNRQYAADLNDFFTVRLLMLLEECSFEKLEEVAPTGFVPLLPPGDADQMQEDSELLQRLTSHMLATD